MMQSIHGTRNCGPVKYDFSISIDYSESKTRRMYVKIMVPKMSFELKMFQFISRKASNSKVLSWVLKEELSFMYIFRSSDRKKIMEVLTISF